MSLQNNSFYILNVSCTAGRKEIMAAAEKMSLLLDPEVCANAQNELLNPHKRLFAEINWFLDVEEETISFLRSFIEKREPILFFAIDLNCNALSELNKEVYNFPFENRKMSGEVEVVCYKRLIDAILLIDTWYYVVTQDKGIAEITETINKNRAFAKIAKVQDKDVQEVLIQKREEIRSVISDVLNTFEQDAYAEIITIITERIANGEGDKGGILSDLVDQYEIRMQSVLNDRSSSIKKIIKNTKTDFSYSFKYNLEETIKYLNSLLNIVLIRRVRQWDFFAQPLQLISKATGMPHKASEELAAELREFVLFLQNEKGLTKEALTLVNALKDIFSEIGDWAEVFENDSMTLQNLLQNKNGKEKKSDGASAEPPKSTDSPVSKQTKTKATTEKRGYLEVSTVHQINELDNYYDRFVKLAIVGLHATSRPELKELQCITGKGITLVKIESIEPIHVDEYDEKHCIYGILRRMPSRRYVLTNAFIDLTAQNKKIIIEQLNTKETPVFEDIDDDDGFPF